MSTPLKPRVHRSPLALLRLEDRTVPSGGKVTVQFSTEDVEIVGDQSGNDVTITEVGARQFLVTGNNGTQIVDKNGQVQAGGVSGTLGAQGEIFGHFNGTADDTVTITGSGQGLVRGASLYMGDGSDHVNVTGMQLWLLSMQFGVQDAKDAGHDYVNLDSDYMGTLSINGGSGGLNMVAGQFLAGDPAKPNKNLGVFVNATSSPTSNDALYFHDFAVFGSMKIIDFNRATVLVAGSLNPGYQGLVKNNLEVQAGAIGGTDISDIEVGYLSVGQTTTVGWAQASQTPLNPSTITLLNVDSGGPLTVDVSNDPLKTAGKPMATHATISGCSAPQFTYKPNKLSAAINMANSKFTTLSLNGGASNDSFTLDQVSADKPFTINAGEGLNTLTLTGTRAPSISLFAGSGNDTFTLGGCTTNAFKYDAGGGTNNLTINASVLGRTGLQGGSGPDTLAIASSSANLLKFNGGEGANSFSLTDTQVAGDLGIKTGSGDDTTTLSNDSVQGDLQYDVGAGLNKLTMSNDRISGDASFKGGAGSDGVTLHSCSIGGDLSYDGGDAPQNFFNVFLIDGGSKVGQNAVLIGGNGRDDIAINETNFGTLSKGKAVGGNVTIAPGGTDSNYVRFSNINGGASSPVRIRGNLAITAIRAAVSLQQMEVSGTSKITFRGNFGDQVTNSELYVDACTFFGKFDLNNAGGADYIQFGCNWGGAQTTFYKGLDMAGVTGSAWVQLSTTGFFEGFVDVWGPLVYKVSLHVGPGYHKR